MRARRAGQRSGVLYEENNWAVVNKAAGAAHNACGPQLVEEAHFSVLFAGFIASTHLWHALPGWATALPPAGHAGGGPGGRGYVGGGHAGSEPLLPAARCPQGVACNRSGSCREYMKNMKIHIPTSSIEHL